MKVFAYRVVQQGPRKLEAVIDRLHGCSLEDRVIAGSDLRLEERLHRRGFLFADFARARGGHGPGRMSPTAALQEIPLRAGESFGEDTAMAYDPATGYAAIQYNHFGPRSRSIEDYLYAFDMSLGGLRTARAGERNSERCGFRFGALLKRNSYTRLKQFGIIHEIEFTIALPGVDQNDLRAGRSLGEILAAPLPQGVGAHLNDHKGRPGPRGRTGS